MTEQVFEYWKPRPSRHGVMWWALLVPAVIYSLGVIVYAHAAFSPGDIAENGHYYGSGLMVIGGEAGTLAAASEVFRKWQAKESNALDWLGLAVSLVATLGNLFVVYTALTTLSDTWVAWVRSYGPLALLLCSGLDFYANVMEFGFYNASFDERIERWHASRHNAKLAWERRQDDAPNAPATQSERINASDAQAKAQDGAEDGAECEYCGRTFANPQGLSAHLRFCKKYQAQKSG